MRLVFTTAPKQAIKGITLLAWVNVLFVSDSSF